MNYDIDENKVLTRVCTPCLEGTSDSNNFVLDEDHEKVKCMYCDSTDTTEQVPKWRWYRCNTCGATFRRI